MFPALYLCLSSICSVVVLLDSHAHGCMFKYDYVLKLLTNV
jgi:hypothetical protein